MSHQRQPQPAAAAVTAVEDLIDQVVAAYFAAGRPARSMPFRSGFGSALALATLGRAPALDFEQGTAEHDAWFAGFDAGHRAWTSEAQTQYLIARLKGQVEHGYAPPQPPAAGWTV